MDSSAHQGLTHQHPWDLNLVVMVVVVVVLVTRSCLTLCNHMGCRPMDFCVHGILQTKILEWIAISFSNLVVLG